MLNEQILERYKENLEYHKNKMIEAFEKNDFVEIAEQARCISEASHMIDFYNKKNNIEQD